MRSSISAQEKPLKTLKKGLAWGLSFALLILVLGYVYLIGSLIFGTLGRQQIMELVRQAAAETAVLEANYLELTGSITIETAREMGFKDAAAVTAFVAVGDDQLAAARLPSQ